MNWLCFTSDFKDFIIQFIVCLLKYQELPTFFYYLVGGESRKCVFVFEILAMWNIYTRIFTTNKI